jgi:hypothetical protein
MEMSIEAMKQALEALESIRPQNMTPLIHPAKTALRVAIASYSTAIEEAEQERSSVKQEPVAWDSAFKEWAYKRGVWPRLTHEEIFKAGWDAAHTTPPAAPVQEHEPENEPFVSLASVQSAERVEPVAHDYRIRYDRGCYKCTSHYCPGNCVAATPPAAQPAPVQDIGVEQDERVFARIAARKNRDAAATRPATREEKIVNPGVYEVPAQENDWLDKEKPETDWDHVWLLIKAASYASARGHMSGTSNWGAAMSAYLRHSTPPAAPVQEKNT